VPGTLWGIIRSDGGHHFPELHRARSIERLSRVSALRVIEPEVDLVGELSIPAPTPI
jgi:hypothetical protein